MLSPTERIYAADSKSQKSNNPKKSDKKPHEVKVTICHVTDSTRAVKIEVSKSAVDSHLAHGDFFGHALWTKRAEAESRSAESRICKILEEE